MVNYIKATSSNVKHLKNGNRFGKKVIDGKELARKQALEFLKLLRPKGPWLLIAFDPERGLRQACITTSKDADVETFIDQHNGKMNIYYSLNVTDRNLAKKPTKADITRIEFFHTDLDPNKDETPEQAKERYQAALKEMELDVSLFVDSGNGLQTLLRLKKPFDIEWTDEEIAAYEATKTLPERVARYEAVNKALMAELGCDDTSTFNIDRILRVPGTTNLPNAKKLEAGRVECLAALLGSSDADYTPDDFAELVAKQAEKTTKPSPKKKKARQEEGEESPIPRRLQTMLYTTEHDPYASRSELLFAFLTETLKLGISEDVIADACLEPTFKGCAIYEHCMQNKGEKYLRRQITKAAGKNASDTGTTTYVSIKASDVPPRQIDWDWKHHLAKGEIDLLTGLPGLGKSQIQCYFVACGGRRLRHHGSAEIDGGRCRSRTSSLLKMYQTR